MTPTVSRCSQDERDQRPLFFLFYCLAPCSEAPDYLKDPLPVFSSFTCVRKLTGNLLLLIPPLYQCVINVHIKSSLLWCHKGNWNNHFLSPDEWPHPRPLSHLGFSQAWMFFFLQEAELSLTAGGCKHRAKCNFCDGHENMLLDCPHYRKRSENGYKKALWRIQYFSYFSGHTHILCCFLANWRPFNSHFCLHGNTEAWPVSFNFMEQNFLKMITFS